MALPTSRNHTYAVGGQVFSADLNDLQDCIIGMKVPAHYRWWGFHPGAPLVTNIAFDNGGGVYDGRLRATANTAVLKGFTLGSVPVGYRPKALAMYAAGTGAAQTLTTTLYKQAVGGGLTSLGTVSAGATPSGTNTLYTLDPLTTVAALATGEHLVVEAAIGLSTSTIFAIGVQFDKL